MLKIGVEKQDGSSACSIEACGERRLFSEVAGEADEHDPIVPSCTAFYQCGRVVVRALVHAHDLPSASSCNATLETICATLGARRRWEARS